MVSNASPTQHSRQQPFKLQATTVAKLRELADLQKVAQTVELEELLVLAHGVIAAGDHKCADPRFIARLRELAARSELEHPKPDVHTSYGLHAVMITAIRELRNELQLPNRDLVVEYTIQAAWDTKPGGGGRKPIDVRDELARRRNAASRNLHPRVAAPPAALPNDSPPVQLRLLKEEYSE